MYELNVNGTIYTCPKTSLITLALQKAIDYFVYRRRRKDEKNSSDEMSRKV